VSGAFAGIDVGERRVHCALVDAAGRVLDCTSLEAGDAGALGGLCSKARVVAVDAPEAPSTGPHADRTDLAPKFRGARCAEIELGRAHGAWVPWVAPAGPPFPPWMEVGFAVYGALRRADGPELLEVYPHAAFRELAGGRRPARKQSLAGRRQRAELLGRAGLRGGLLADEPSHDTLDALVAALVALDRSRGRARRVSCGHDDSAIWLPSPVA
jgi:predicted nuclease with RNAse H fold